MTSPPTITNADDSRLVSLINGATERLVLAAPGVSATVAEALTAAWRRLGANACTVILDADSEVCRLGYGTLDALKSLRAAAADVGALVCHQPGLRIGLVIADERTLVFSPTPLLIEAGSDAPTRPNAIELGPPPAAMARDLGLGPAGHRDRRIGLDPVDPQRVDEVERDLAVAPPVKFDLARRVRVFTSRFQFVELEMSGCFISRRRVSIPSALVGLAGMQDVERQFSAHFALVQRDGLAVKSGDKTVSERTLQDHRGDIERQFLVSIAGYGRVVLRANKAALELAVADLTQEVAAFSQGLKSQLDAAIAKARSAVVAALLPAVLGNPPREYTKTLGPNPPSQAIGKMLDDDVARAFGNAESMIKEMEVRLIFKDVAYESLVDKKFIEAARRAMPHVEFLHREYEAAPGAP